MVESAIDIVLSVVIFAIIAFLFIKTFGVPSCESAANQTALQLKYAIDEVADDRFPKFDTDNPNYEEPTNSHYYTTVPIKLCQQHGTFSYFMSFLGGMPEWQIYYERFPEGGGGIWNEAYPWGGGAASNFIFWAAMRGVSVAGKLAARLTKIYAGWRVIQLFQKARNMLKFRAWIKKEQDLFMFNMMFKELTRASSPPIFVQNGRQLNAFTDKLEERDATYILRAMGEEGFVEHEWNETDQTVKYYAVGDKILLRDEDIPVTVTQTIPDMTSGSVTAVSKKLYVYQQGGGVLDPERADWNDIKEVDLDKDISSLVISNPDDYILLTINPRQEMKQVYESLKEEQPERAKEIMENFAFDDTGKVLEENVTNSSLIKKLYNEENGVKNSIRIYKNYLTKNSYNSNTSDNEHTMQTGTEILFRITAAENILNLAPTDVIGTLSDGTSVYAKNFSDMIIKPIIESQDYGFKDKIIYYSNLYGISITPQVTSEDAIEVLKRIWKEEGGGFVFYPDSDLTNVFVRLKDIIIISDGTATLSEMMQKVKTLNNFNTYFGLYENRINDIAEDLNETYWDVKNADPLATNESIQNNFSIKLEEYLIKNLVAELTAADKGLYDQPPYNVGDNAKIKEMIENQLGMIIGLFYKNENVATIPLKRSPVRLIKKFVFTQVKRFVSPFNWMAKGMILGQMTKRCTGNSICVYVDSSQYESPYFLNESAINYDVRLWRPIEPWKQWVGWSAALQHVPPHPTFYVVSPCFAVAKVWKTELESGPTIFVHPIKVDMNGERSNYCYADSDLINAYTSIWAAGDAAAVLEVIFTWGVSSGKVALKESTKTIVKKTLGTWTTFDPVTLAQAAAEAYISWPGAPFTSLNLTDMEENNENAQAFKDLQESLENQFG